MTITVAGPDADAVMEQVVEKCQWLVKRGGTSRINVALERYLGAGSTV